MLKQNIFGISGIIIALIALILAIFQDNFRPPPEKTTLAQDILSIGKSLAGVKEKKHNPYDAIGITYIALGILGFIAAIVSYAQKEPLKIAGIAGSVAIAAILWEYVIVAFVIALVILFLYYLEPILT